MVTLTLSLLRLMPLTLLLLLPATHALNFSVASINCTQLDWSVTLSQPEWSVASFVELSFISTQGARNYSLLYSSTYGGEFPAPGTYSISTGFGDTRLSGGYRIGVALADGNRNVLTTSTSSSSGGVQVTAIDARVFTFGNCVAGGAGAVSAGVSGAAASTSSASAAPSSTSAAQAVSSSSAPLSSATSASAASSSAAAATSAPTNPTSPSSSTATIPSAPTSSINKGAIAGGVVGGVVVLLIALALLRWCTSCRRTRRLSQAANRMSGLRPLTLTEKLSADGFVTPAKTRASASRDTFEVVNAGWWSESSRRKSFGWTPRKGSRGDGVSIVYGVETEVERDPFSSADGYASRGIGARSTEHVPTYPGVGAQLERTRSAPLVIELPHISVTPLASPTGSAFRSVLTSPSTSTFRIPRVSVPSYQGEDAAAADAVSVHMSRSSSMRRISTDVGTFEGPFYDAAQEQVPMSQLEKDVYGREHV
ncbi:conserved hypothetical protein [Sporisorium reilianum SRZ2]|uniref:Uncharacterized protein n=1 Tax=Sporisorium reilianum (strain SRZ2) TaxID=999809 RepID=E6ZLX6_SPORE|nr:conserved hypothetical protein [Sporisorium reilianum SRZ2]